MRGRTALTCRRGHGRGSGDYTAGVSEGVAGATGPGGKRNRYRVDHPQAEQTVARGSVVRRPGVGWPCAEARSAVLFHRLVDARASPARAAAGARTTGRHARLRGDSRIGGLCRGAGPSISRLQRAAHGAKRIDVRTPGNRLCVLYLWHAPLLQRGLREGRRARCGTDPRARAGGGVGFHERPAWPAGGRSHGALLGPRKTVPGVGHRPKSGRRGPADGSEFVPRADQPFRIG